MRFHPFTEDIFNIYEDIASQANYKMNISSAIHYLEQGYKITRSAWNDNNIYLQKGEGNTINYIYYKHKVYATCFSSDMLLADDWKIIS